MKRPLAYLVIVLCLLLFATAATTLLLHRIERGNVYPAGSSLRTDPLGSMMLWESLSALTGFSVERDHSPVTRLPHGKNTTYLHLGGASRDWRHLSDNDDRAIEEFVLQGGRLVVTLHPDSPWQREKKNEKPEPSPSPSRETSPSPTPPQERNPDGISLKEKWSLTLDAAEPAREKPLARRTAHLPDLPSSLPWHGNVVLKDLGPAWTVIYTRDGNPVVAEMKRGAGTIVFLTDSYLLSNEALVRDRHSALLAWVVGPHSHVVFDEAHHGIVDSPGLASMARRYGLTGGAFAFLAWVGLFLWKNSSSLAPRPMAKSAADQPVEGRSSFSGFAAMLRRNIPRSELFAVCWSEWQKTFARSRRFSKHRQASAEAVVTAEASRPARERDPVDAYRRVHHILHPSPAKP